MITWYLKIKLKNEKAYVQVEEHRTKAPEVSKAVIPPNQCSCAQAQFAKTVHKWYIITHTRVEHMALYVPHNQNAIHHWFREQQKMWKSSNIFM